MAAARGRPHKLSVYHAGRGHDPVVVAARGKSLVTVKAMHDPPVFASQSFKMSLSQLIVMRPELSSCALPVGASPTPDGPEKCNGARRRRANVRSWPVSAVNGRAQRFRSAQVFQTSPVPLSRGRHL